MCNVSQGIFERGMAQGMERGMAQGMAQGMERGITKGEVAKAIVVVQNLLKKGFTLNEALVIAEIDKKTYEEALQ